MDRCDEETWGPVRYRTCLTVDLMRLAHVTVEIPWTLSLLDTSNSMTGHAKA